MKTASRNVVKQDGRWYPVMEDGQTIDQRGPGSKTKNEAIVKLLGFQPEIHFVTIERGGAIGFSAGKPEEIQSLARAVQKYGFKMSKGLRNALDRV
jgi:hypothetical protein